MCGAIDSRPINIDAVLRTDFLNSAGGELELNMHRL
jgi:hypothetical protein